MTLGNRIKNYRVERGMTQIELAKKAGLSQGYLSDLEKNRFNPTTPIIIGIAVALDVSVDGLLGMNEEKKVS